MKEGICTNSRLKTIIEWGLIILLIVPVYLMARARMHHRNLGLFILLSLLCVAAVIICYFIFVRKFDEKKEGSQQESS